MHNHTAYHTPSTQNAAKRIESAFDTLGRLMHQEAKRYNEERKKVQENLNNGARITKHRINL